MDTAEIVIQIMQLTALKLITHALCSRACSKHSNWFTQLLSASIG